MLNIAKEAARNAGMYLNDRFTHQLFPDLETHNDVKLPEDKESERLIIETIHAKYPDHTIFSEEIGVMARESDYTWIVDPLDGTNNYFIGYPYFSVSLALQHAGDIVLGVVYNPVADQMFWAEKGKGAYLNGKRLQVNNRTELNKSVGTFVRGRDAMSKQEEMIFTQQLFLQTKRLMRNIAPALDWCLLAHGWIDYIVMKNSGVMDVAAGILIAEEAGALVTDFQGEKYRHQIFDLSSEESIVASNGCLHDKILTLVGECSKG